MRKLWQQIKSLFTEKTTTVYMLKRVDKYYGLQGCSYVKKTVLVRVNNALDRRFDAITINSLQDRGYYIVTKERFDSVQ